MRSYHAVDRVGPSSHSVRDQEAAETATSRRVLGRTYQNHSIPPSQLDVNYWVSSRSQECITVHGPLQNIHVPRVLRRSKTDRAPELTEPFPSSAVDRPREQTRSPSVVCESSQPFPTHRANHPLRSQAVRRGAGAGHFELHSDQDVVVPPNPELPDALVCISLNGETA